MIDCSYLPPSDVLTTWRPAQELRRVLECLLVYTCAESKDFDGFEGGLDGIVPKGQVTFVYVCVCVRACVCACVCAWCACVRVCVRA
jgi:hypothetical protein